MKRSARTCALILGATLWLGWSWAARGEASWEAGAEAGVVHAVGAAPVFEWANRIGVSALRRIGARWALGVMGEHRRVIETAPASSFFYVDVGVRGQLTFTPRAWLRLDLGWGWRHIGIEGSYSNTVGGVVIGAGLGLIVLKGRAWELACAAVFHTTRAWPTWETFFTNSVGAVAAWSIRW